MEFQVGIYDYAMIGFYLVFMVAVGLIYRKQSKNISDFFRSGGSLSWWLVGSSAFVTIFSAWTFVGCAGKVYRSGTIAGLIFLFNALSLTFSYWLVPRIRRLRVITWVSAIKDRFGSFAEQFYAWITMLIGFLFGGVSLYTLAVFLHPIFGISVPVIIVVISAVITVMAASGGTSGLIVGDFVQCLLIVFVALVTAFMIVRIPEVGGVSGLLDKVPQSHFRWSDLEAKQVLWFWAVGIFINQFVAANNVQAGCARYITVKNERHARKALLIPFIGMLLLPLIAFIPPLAATFLIPDIENVYAGLNNPSEAAYIAMAMKVLPQGMVGLLASAIFAASLTSINVVLSVNSSIFVKNIYHSIIRKDASDRELLIAGKITVLVLGAVLCLGGIKFNDLKSIPLFDLTLIVAGLIGMPLVIPVFWGIIIKKTPSWASWTTVIIGFAVAALVQFLLPMEFVANIIGLDRPPSDQEILDMRFASTIISVAVVCTVWFVGSRIFYGKETEKYKRDVDELFERINTPIDEVKEGVVDNTYFQALTVGILCMVYGAAVLLCMLIPNPVAGKLCFAFCGGGMMIFGIGFYIKSRSLKPKL
ncbi:MAG: transporter [Sedimentisphaeraceae bacterium JB056]